MTLRNHEIYKFWLKISFFQQILVTDQMTFAVPPKSSSSSSNLMLPLEDRPPQFKLIEEIAQTEIEQSICPA
jgi:hypothetical protein